MKRHHIRLAVIANTTPEALRRMVDSVRHLIDSVLVIIAPRGYASIPSEGFGYCALETKVLQSPVLASLTHNDLLRFAEADHFVDWVMMLGAYETLSLRVRPADLPLTSDGDHHTIDSAHLVRARSGFTFPDHR